MKNASKFLGVGFIWVSPDESDFLGVALVCNIQMRGGKGVGVNLAGSTGNDPKLNIPTGFLEHPKRFILKILTIPKKMRGEYVNVWGVEGNLWRDQRRQDRWMSMASVQTGPWQLGNQVGGFNRKRLTPALRRALSSIPWVARQAKRGLRLGEGTEVFLKNPNQPRAFDGGGSVQSHKTYPPAALIWRYVSGMDQSPTNLKRTMTSVRKL